MGMPQIPDGKNRPSFEETMIDLLEAIALEEMALSHIMNAEGEKLQELIRKYYYGELNFCELEYSCKNMQGMMNSLIMKEWLLLSKLGTIMEVNHNLGGQMRATQSYPHCQKKCNETHHQNYPTPQNNSCYNSQRYDINYPYSQPNQVPPKKFSSCQTYYNR